MALKTDAVENRKKPTKALQQKGDIAVLWIDWYAYHVARFRALCENPKLRNRVKGIEMVGGTGVHRGLKFREPIPGDLPVRTLFADGDWGKLSKWQIAAALWRQLNRDKPATILVPGYYNVPALAIALWGRLHGKRTVLMTESTEFDHRRRPLVEFFKSALIRTLFSWAIAGGAPHRRYLQKLKFPSERIGSFYDVVDNRFFRDQATRDRNHHTARDFRLPVKYFLFVGRLAEEKNVRCLLDAYVDYRRAGGTWSLVLVGDGPLRTALNETAKASGYGADIYFEGLKNSGELSPYYAFAGCFVLPSSREPWGLVVNEAMASGLPVLITRQCGCAEDLVVDGVNGFLFDAADPAGLTSRLCQFENLSDAERRMMGRRSQESIGRYAPEAWAEEVARIAND